MGSWSGSLACPKPQFPYLYNQELFSQLYPVVLRCPEPQYPRSRKGEGPKGSLSIGKTHVGSLAKFRKRQTFPMVPFCSKSDLKNLAVSMFT